MAVVKKVSYSFTRPSDTTQYTAADLVANSTTAGSVVPLMFNVGRGSVRILSASITKNDAADVTAADFSLHLFGSSPTVANGDNGALSFNFSQKFADLDFATMVAATDVAWATSTGLNLVWNTSSGIIYGLIEADGTYTPASGEIFTVILVFEKI